MTYEDSTECSGRGNCERCAAEDAPVAESVFGPVAKWGRLEFPLPEDRAPEHGRDELAALIHEFQGWLVGDPGAAALADAIIAAGWRHQ